MGHLTRIANALAQDSEKWPHSNLIKQLVKGRGGQAPSAQHIVGSDFKQLCC